MRGDKQTADEYRDSLEKLADRWITEADAGDHFRLTFDRPDSWSQKYNLVWDRVLGLDLFSEGVRQKEMDYYLSVQNEFGLPLDSRSTYTKLDWVLWTATLTENKSDFAALVHPVFRFLQETPDKSPMTDWYHTHNARKVGFTARPVVGGVFMQLLYDQALWKKWSDSGSTKPGTMLLCRPPQKSRRQYLQPILRLRIGATPSNRRVVIGPKLNMTTRLGVKAPLDLERRKHLVRSWEHSGIPTTSGCGVSSICQKSPRDICSSTFTMMKTQQSISTASQRPKSQAIRMAIFTFRSPLKPWQL